jgi:hypothetical protein
MRRGVMAAVALLCICLSAPTTAAHDPTTFTVIVGENGAEPSNISGQVLFTNDSIWFRNVDNSENKTHRLTIDMNGDGLFNGTDDLSSGNLSSSCELDDNGTKVDSTCEVVWKVALNSSTGLIAGTFNYIDEQSDGNVTSGRFVVNLDDHPANVGPDPNYSLDPEEEQEENVEEVTNSDQQMLIVISMSAAIAAGAILLLMMRPTPIEMDFADESD